MNRELLVPRIKDTVRICETSSMPRFIGFLTSAEAAEVAGAVKELSCKYEFFGGYEDAERLFFGVFPDWCEDRSSFWPVVGVTFTFRAQDKLSHRDFLGALMSLGITRETVGDILVEEGRAVVFLNRDILSAVLDGIQKIGRVGVIAKEGVSLPLPGASIMTDITETVASLRLDSVVAALIKTSRSKAVTLIEEGLVSVNSLSVEKTTKTVTHGDKITVRGYGKFVIESALGRTKKDRIVLIAKKYT
ncbi:MAG: hypothetical protein J6V50_00170 [Clostridia bacterium]|nr:hypothetical protein [Clostridia bacterium]